MDLFSEGSIHEIVSNIPEGLRREHHGEQTSALCTRAPECDSLHSNTIRTQASCACIQY